MRTVWKYSLNEFFDQKTDQIEIEMPKYAEVLSVQLQADVPTMWALVDPEFEKEDREFVIVGTGHDIPEREHRRRRYVATFQTGAYVWHLFEVMS